MLNIAGCVDLRGVQPLLALGGVALGRADAEHELAQVLAEQGREQVGATVVGLLEGRFGGVEIAPHAQVLGALPGKTKASSGCPGRLPSWASPGRAARRALQCGTARSCAA